MISVWLTSSKETLLMMLEKFSMKWISHIHASFGTTKAIKLIEHASENIYKDFPKYKILIYQFNYNFVGLNNLTSCSIFSHFHFKLNCNIFLIKNATEFVRHFSQSVFETPLTHSILKEIDDGFSRATAMSWLHRTSISEKVTFLKRCPLLKKFFFWKSSF